MLTALTQVKRLGASSPAEFQPVGIDLDAVELAKPVTVAGVDGPCVELRIDSEKIIVRGTVEEIVAASQIGCVEIDLDDQEPTAVG